MADGNAAPIRTLLVEFYSGTGTISKYAKKVGFTETITIDNDQQRRADKRFSTLDVGAMCGLGAEVQAFKDQGYLVAVHASPPCQRFSRAGNGVRAKRTPAVNAAALVLAVNLVNVALKFAKEYAHVWTLENPGTGSLWTEHADKINYNISRRRRLDICRYGSPMKKNMCLAFSSKRLTTRFGKTRLCLGKYKCPCMHLNPKTNFATSRHVNLAEFPLTMRIAFPDSLCVDLMSVVHEELREIAENGLELDSDDMSEESTDPSAESDVIESEEEERPQIVHFANVSRRYKRVNLKFEGSELYKTVSLEEALEDEWVSEDMKKRFCKAANLWIVERIVMRRLTPHGPEVRIKWLGFENRDNSWEPAAEFE